MEFLTDWGVVIALVCAGCALIYGVVTSRWLLALSPGNQEMQDISTAVQEGAKAYLRRQYTIIAGVAVVLAIVLAIGLEAQDANGILVAIGFLIGGTFSGAAGFIGMNVSVRANARVAESARSRRFARRSRWPSRAAPSPACSWRASRCSAWPATTES